MVGKWPWGACGCRGAGAGRCCGAAAAETPPPPLLTATDCGQGDGGVTDAAGPVDAALRRTCAAVHGQPCLRDWLLMALYAPN